MDKFEMLGTFAFIVAMLFLGTAGYAMTLEDDRLQEIELRLGTIETRVVHNMIRIDDLETK